MTGNSIIWGLLLGGLLAGAGGLIWLLGAQHGVAPDANRPHTTTPAQASLTTDTERQSAPESEALRDAVEALRQLEDAGPLWTPPNITTPPEEPAAVQPKPRRVPTDNKNAIAAPEVLPLPEPTVPVPAPPAPPPAELCAGTRFINRAICLQRECDRLGMDSHPQCLQMREKQNLLRHSAGES